MADGEEAHTQTPELVSACLAHYGRREPLPAGLVGALPHICEYLFSAACKGQQTVQDENLVLYLLGDHVVNTGEINERLDTICRAIFDNLPESNRDILDAAMYVNYQIDPPDDIGDTDDQTVRIKQYMHAINARRFREYLMLNRRNANEVSAEVYSYFFILKERFSRAGEFAEIGDLVSGNPRLRAVTEQELSRGAIVRHADWPQNLPRWERNANAVELPPESALREVEIAVHPARETETVTPLGKYL